MAKGPANPTGPKHSSRRKIMEQTHTLAELQSILPPVGTRIKLKRYADWICQGYNTGNLPQAGDTGTVTELYHHPAHPEYGWIVVTMDHHFTDLDEWDNELHIGGEEDHVFQREAFDAYCTTLLEPISPALLASMKCAAQDTVEQYRGAWDTLEGEAYRAVAYLSGMVNYAEVNATMFFHALLQEQYKAEENLTIAGHFDNGVIKDAYYEYALKDALEGIKYGIRVIK
jgi:hypothetical protein